MLLGRNKVANDRDPMMFKAKIGNSIFMGAIVAIIFTNVGFHNKDGLEDKIPAELIKNPQKDFRLYR